VSHPLLTPVTAAALTLGAVAWVALLWTAPALARHAGHPAAGAPAALAYTAGAVVCHQASHRSFHLDGVRTPVCARCAGLYTGAALGLVLWWPLRRRRWGRTLLAGPGMLIVVAAVPTAVTWLTAIAGIWDPANLPRALSALPLGLTGGAVVAAVTAGELR
jgi:uncharacterized membrane protein